MIISNVVEILIVYNIGHCNFLLGSIFFLDRHLKVKGGIVFNK